MSKANVFARHARIETDRAISRVYREFSFSPEQAGTFCALLSAVRDRSGFLRPAVIRDGRHLQVEALRNLTRFRAKYMRDLETWPGASGSPLCVVASLAGHLLARYSVPKFLASVWFGNDVSRARERRQWYIDHAGGRRFRDLSLPLSITRRMEHLFLASPDHLTLEPAIRVAEMHALEASPELIEAVLLTRLGERLENGHFWRTVLRFFVRGADELDVAMVGPIVDFLQAIRHDRVEVETDAGPASIPPPRPDFSMKGRTLPSVLRLVRNWHRALGLTPTATQRWVRSRQQPMIFTDPPVDEGVPPVQWEFVELTNSTDLRREGAALRHCVASYAAMCVRGRARIWSLRRRTSPGRARPIITIEVNPSNRSIVQARGLHNRPAWGHPLQLLRAWAQREQLRLII